MELKLIDGHNRIVFDKQDEKHIIELFVNDGLSCRAISRFFGIKTIKPIVTVLDKYKLDHTRGNLTSFKYYFPNGIYDEEYENSIREMIRQIPSKKQKYDINDYYFDNIRDPEVIYTIGFLYADGCNYDCTDISLCLEERDGYILKRINTNIKNEYPVKYVDLSNKHDFGYNYENQYRLSIYNKRIAKVLNILGVTPKKSLTLTFPRWLHPSMYNHFLRGVYDGDGSIYRYIREKSTPQFNLTITSTETFCKSMVDICASYLRILGHIYDASCRNGVTKVFTLCGPIPTKKFLDWLYKDATIFLDRKYNRYCDYYNINKSDVA